MRHADLLAVGKQIRKVRQSRGISQEKLAELVGVHRNFTGMVERGESNCGVLTLIKIARVLKVKPSKLLSSL